MIALIQFLRREAKSTPFHSGGIEMFVRAWRTVCTGRHLASKMAAFVHWRSRSLWHRRCLCRWSAIILAPRLWL